MECDQETPVDDFCHAWEGSYLDIPRVELKPYDQFYIQFKIEFTYVMAMEEEEQEEDDKPDYLSGNLQSINFCHQFWERCEKLSCNNLTWDTIHRMLSRLGVPTHKQPFMIQKISGCADEIASKVENRTRKVLPMIVSIGVVVDNTREEHLLAMRESREAELRISPASKEAVEALEKVKVEDCEIGASHCMICMEKLEDGCEATRMPCLHVYHGSCIVNWLGVSNVCPLCRYQLPY
ncbi:E3 ubiquitin-protein ligase MPSR1-like [Coffea arabica]|uniref:RING-type E3 ubiquitin transferase n=1 Tax=Coffea arabica TaxID=13443 RepID=A0A6P6X3Z6_COFAR|nr:E3 ubiquitin-protein ligase MPSR1-like [Coffea arabica]